MEALQLIEAFAKEAPFTINTHTSQSFVMKLNIDLDQEETIKQQTIWLNTKVREVREATISAVKEAWLTINQEPLSEEPLVDVNNNMSSVVVRLSTPEQVQRLLRQAQADDAAKEKLCTLRINDQEIKLVLPAFSNQGHQQRHKDMLQNNLLHIINCDPSGSLCSVVSDHAELRGRTEQLLCAVLCGQTKFAGDRLDTELWRHSYQQRAVAAAVRLISQQLYISGRTDAETRTVAASALKAIAPRPLSRAQVPAIGSLLAHYWLRSKKFKITRWAS